MVTCMTIASGPAGPVLAGPDFTFDFKIAHMLTSNNQLLKIIPYQKCSAARVTAAVINTSSAGAREKQVECCL